jgi:hypothetical protein
VKWRRKLRGSGLIFVSISWPTELSPKPTKNASFHRSFGRRKFQCVSCRYHTTHINLMHNHNETYDKIQIKRQGALLNAPGLALITTILASLPLDTCGSPNTLRTYSTWNSNSSSAWSTCICKRWPQLNSAMHWVQSAIWCRIKIILISLILISYFTNLPLTSLFIN